MKSAYELAMERLNKTEGSSKSLSAGQKSRLAEVDRLYKGKMAEREIFLKQKLEQALSEQNFQEVEAVRQQMASEKARLEEEKEAEKEKVRGKG